MNITSWAMNNEPDESLIYKKGMNNQVDRFLQLAEELGLKEPTVPSTHISKSVELPVPRFEIPNGVIFVRDNFYDIKMTVVSGTEIELDYDDIYCPYSKEKYEKDKKSSLNGRPNKYKENKADYDGDDWYHKHWSSGPLVREGDKTWTVGRIHEVYCEGISCIGLPSSAFEPYKKIGKSNMIFTLETYDYAGLKELMARVIRSAANRCRSEADSIIKHCTTIIADLAAKDKVVTECCKQLKEIWEAPEKISTDREVLQTKVEMIIAIYRLKRFNKTDSQAAMNILTEVSPDYIPTYKPDIPLHRQDFTFKDFISELRRFQHIAWREVI